MLVFDNAESFGDLRRYWPASDTGSILVTTQNPAFASVCDTDIILEPLTPAEGCSFIQFCLRRGKSETAEAEALSEELGGLPLAIAHFSGYVIRSQCTINHILDTLRARLQSSQIWEVNTTEVTGAYQHTLSTVWDLVWARLNDESRTILQFLAFLNPDSIPEEMFVGKKGERDSKGGWEYWDKQR